MLRMRSRRGDAVPPSPAATFRQLAHDHVAKGRTAVLLVSKHPATRKRTKPDSLARQRWLTGTLLHALLVTTRRDRQHAVPVP
jgi:hypothetical protein